MDAATRAMMVKIAAPIIRKALMLQAAGLVSHGMLNANYTEAYVSIGVAIAGAVWSFWNDYLREIVVARMEVWKAKSLAQAAALHAAGIPPVTNVEIAAHGPEALTPAAVAKVVATLAIAALIVMVALAAPALAEGPIARKIEQDIAAKAAGTVSGASSDALSALAKPFQDIAKFIADDADAAVALATAVPEIQDGHGQQCWMAMGAFGKVVKAHPVPATLRVMTDFEALRLLAIAANNLCTNVHCTQVFGDGTAMAQAASPIPLIIPSLHDLCTKVPQIAVVAPVSVPGAVSDKMPAVPSPVAPQ